MAVQQLPVETLARTYTETAVAAFRDLADYLDTLSEHAWAGSTGSTEWTIRVLADHVAGEALYFPNLVRGVTEGEPPLPAAAYEAMQSLTGTQLTENLRRDADSLREAMSTATPRLEHDVDFGAGPQPLWVAVNVAAMEATLHNWDAHVGRDPAATIPGVWADALAIRLHEFARYLTQKGEPGGADGVFRVTAGDSVGPITITISAGSVRIVPGESGTPDVVLETTADQYVRLLWGRLDLKSALDDGTLPSRGDRSRAADLTKVFRGA